MKPKEIRVLGVMTGTSCDGLDAACLSITPSDWAPLWSASAPYPSKLRARVLAAQKPDSLWSARTWLELDRDLGQWYAETLSKIIGRHKRSVRPQLIANHGQTVAHYPGGTGKGVTLQLGEPSWIAAKTGLTVASHFRQGDIAAGGQGAPLVPLFHQMLAQALSDNGKGGIALHNLGGISNFTYLGPRGKILAFDTGPGNIWIDAATQLATRGKQKMDRGGKLAQRGSPCPALLARWFEHPYLRKAPPKSTGRDDFPIESVTRQSLARGADLVSTATYFTVETIGRAYEQWVLAKRLPLHSIYVCGGGANNPVMMEWLQSRMEGIAEVYALDEAGFDPQLIEAQAFAMFGYFALHGESLGGSWTGAKTFGPPARITPGKNWSELHT